MDMKEKHTRSKVLPRKLLHELDVETLLLLVPQLGVLHVWPNLNGVPPFAVALPLPLVNMLRLGGRGASPLLQVDRAGAGTWRTAGTPRPPPLAITDEEVAIAVVILPSVTVDTEADLLDTANDHSTKKKRYSTKYGFSSHESRPCVHFRQRQLLARLRADAACHLAA